MLLFCFLAAETIARIREKTQEAMNKPQVLSLSLFLPFSLRGSQPESQAQLDNLMESMFSLSTKFPVLTHKSQ
jgi:hypothetical protein